MTYYVGTLGRYVLVDAENEVDARERAHSALYELYTDVRQRLGKDAPINVATVRHATADEIELGRWHQQMVAAERA